MLEVAARLRNISSQSTMPSHTASAILSNPDADVATQPRTGPKKAIDRLHEEFTLDEDITGRWVQLKDEQTGKLREPQTLLSILSTIDRDKQAVRQLGAPPNAPVIVEVTAWEALRSRIQAKEASQAAAAKSLRDSKPKQIELNWAISAHDLDLKMKQLKEFVEKGKKVEILLAAKKRQRRATPEEAQNVVKHIRKTISEIERCKELAPMDGTVGGQALMVVQKTKG
ncbi:hypothetical protein H2198_003701 [Neophaeococcomyces mojaviensis]|uniref:Uncharacterized protein n=1 Tax=Neophaeococcomyces mojaviensis TaxID=3383035 RepID=A0ACC3AAR6_9EURO|nr:hypothetical protein H2198_003701 [Knufia sp. JES_112]